MLDRRHFIFSFCLSALSLSSRPALANDHKKAHALISDYIRKNFSNTSKSLTLLYPDGSLSNLEPLIQSFFSETGIEVKTIKTSVDNMNARIFLNTAQQKSNFDIALPATFGIPDLVEAGAFENLDAYAKKHHSLHQRELSLYPLGDRYKGKKYGYQTDGDVYLMFYNQDLLKKDQMKARYEQHFGHSYQLPLSWQELDQQMAFFHNPENNHYGGCLFRAPDYMVWEWWLRFHAQGQYPLNNEASARVNSDEGITALEDMIKASQYQHPSSNYNGLFENWAEYAKGQCYANIGWGGTQKYLHKQDSLKGKIAYAPTPEVSYFNWGWNYVVSSFSKNKELAYLFCLYATMPEPSLKAVRAEDGFFDPFREHHYTDSKIQAVYSEDFLQAHKTAMKDALPDFYLEGRSRYIKTLKDALQSAYKEELTPREAMTYCNQLWDKITDDIGRDKQIEQWLYLKAQYPQSFKKRSL